MRAIPLVPVAASSRSITSLGPPPAEATSDQPLSNCASVALGLVAERSRSPCHASTAGPYSSRSTNGGRRDWEAGVIGSIARVRVSPRARARARALTTALALLGLLVVDVSPAAAADTITPVVSVGSSTVLAAQGNPIAVTASATDAASKVISADYSIDGGPWLSMSPGPGRGIAPTRPSRALLNAAVATVGAGSAASCALLAEASVWCWGSGHHGALGTGSEASSSAPVRVTGLTAVAKLSVGGDHTCVVQVDGGV